METYDTDASVRELVDKFDWYILPVFNPDGYEFTFTGVSIYIIVMFRDWTGRSHPKDGRRHQGLNSRLLPFEDNALPLSYIPMSTWSRNFLSFNVDQGRFSDIVQTIERAVTR